MPAIVPLIGFFLLLQFAPSCASEGQPYEPPMKGYVCYHVTRPLTIDGRLDDAAWQSAPWTDWFEDIEGSLKPAPRFKTRAKMLWDDSYLYIGAELEEPHVWATLVKRDTVIFRDNDFEVFLDPDGDSQEYYEFEMNALNTVWDLLLRKPYRDGGPPVDSWNIDGLVTAVHIDGTLNDPRDIDRGWSVEIAFPWAALKEYAHRPSPPRDGDQWRINFSRVEWQVTTTGGKYQKVPNTPEDNWIWSPQGIIDMHWPERWGYLQFSTGMPGTVSFKPDPARGVRHLLYQVYYSQRKYFEKHKRWASSLDDLDLAEEEPVGVGKPTLVPTDDGFLATAVLTLPGGKEEQWHIRQDSRIWKEE
jgi:hypothetical protein